MPLQRCSNEKDSSLTTPAFSYSHLKKDIPNDITGERYTTTDHITSTSESFISCTWDSCSSTDAGGAIYLQEDYPLTVIDCSFVYCKSKTASSNYYWGGGAIAFVSTDLLDIKSTSFIHCSASGVRGGAIHVHDIGNVLISHSLFLDCVCSTVGGGILVEDEPSLSLSSSHFIDCHTKIGGACGFYKRKSTFSVSNCLFANNKASDLSIGGGAIVDCLYPSSYLSQYRFSFFTQNKAYVANDIAVIDNAYSSSPIMHCFTTTNEKSFYNCGNEAVNWLPLTNINLLSLHTFTSFNVVSTQTDT